MQQWENVKDFDARVIAQNARYHGHHLVQSLFKGPPWLGLEENFTLGS